MRILLVSRIAAASSVNRITASASAKTKASNRINKTNGRIIVTTTKFLFAVVVVVVATRYFFYTATAMTAINKNKNTIIKKVFCFGDSLTAGTSPPYERELFPYATYLEEALRTRSTSSTNTNIADADADADAANIENNESNDNDNNACHLPEYTSVVVRWKGFPGWQASTLRDDGGLATIISNLIVKGGEDEPPPPPLDLILILAGTNDLTYEDDSSIICSNIQGIHEIAHSYGCKTIALGIPPSGWQIQDSNKVGNIANEVNEKLQSWCCCDNDVGGSSSSTASSSSCSTMVTYVPFPIKEFDRDSGLWAPDGLHLSPEGYKTMGVSLSPIIANILNLC